MKFLQKLQNSVKQRFIYLTKFHISVFLKILWPKTESKAQKPGKQFSTHTGNKIFITKYIKKKNTMQWKKQKRIR